MARRRYIPSYRIRKNVRSASDTLRDQMLRDFEREAAALLKKLNEDFALQLQAQLSQAMQGIVANEAAKGATTGVGSEGLGTFGGFAQLLTAGIRLLVSRPRTSRNEVETSRSFDADSSFRLSRAQAMAEAQTTLARGERNI